MKTLILLLFVYLFAFVACEKLEFKETNSDVAVVESYIQPGDTASAYITKQIVFGSSDTVNQVIENLEVMIYDGSNWYTLGYIGEGLYKGSGLDINIGDEIKLEFSYHNTLIQSETIIPRKPIGFTVSSTTIEAWEPGNGGGQGGPPDMPDPIEISWDNDEGDYHLIVVENIEDDPVTIDDFDEDEDRPRPNFRSMPTQGSTTELQSMSFEYYGTHRVILFRLNAEYAALYEQLGNSSLDIQEPPSNIVNGLGIFTGINSDTLYVTVVD